MAAEGLIGKERFHKDTIRNENDLNFFLENVFKGKRIGTAGKIGESLFSKLKSYINARHDGEIITRKEMTRDKNLCNNNIDVYRRCLTLMGYLEMVDPGIYKKIKTIPDSINTTELKYVYRNKRFNFKQL